MAHVGSYLKSLFLLCFLGASQVRAQDAHEIYERACAACHAPHAGAFVKAETRLSGGVLFGATSGRAVRNMLEQGHGRLSDAETRLLGTHLAWMAQNDQLFARKCTICHDRAVRLARDKLILRDGELIGRYTGRNTASFLSGHGRLTPDQVAPMIKMLTRQLTLERLD